MEPNKRKDPEEKVYYTLIGGIPSYKFPREARERLFEALMDYVFRGKISLEEYSRIEEEEVKKVKEILKAPEN